MLLWVNAQYCGAGGNYAGIDAFDVAAGEWDNAKTPAINHSSHGLDGVTHSPACYHAFDNRFYIKGSGGDFGRYDPVSRTFQNIGHSGSTQGSDAYMVTLGARTFLYSARHSSDPAIRINTQTGAATSWAVPPSGTSAAFAYDSIQDRIYTPTTGVDSDVDDHEPGNRTVSWFDAGATSTPSWTGQTFNGSQPDTQASTGTFGRCAFVPEIKGFVLNNGVDSETYFYRTSQ
jgi:hypothetical protein